MGIGPDTAPCLAREGGLAAHHPASARLRPSGPPWTRRCGSSRDREGEAKILSGGYSLLPLIKLRLAQPALLVDIQAITDLDGIDETAACLDIGSRATHRQIHEAP